MASDYQQYHNKLGEIADLGYAIGVLHWDQEVNLPAKAGELRGRQISTLTGMRHEMAVSDELGEVLEKLKSADSLTEKERRNVEESTDDFTKSKKYSRKFVERLSEAETSGFRDWVEARSKSDFSIFKDSLTKLVDLKRQEAELLGYEAHPYDALMDNYEKGAKTAHIKTLFAGVREQLVDFVQEISAQPQVDDSFLYGSFDKDKQWGLGLKILGKMGYDFGAGRQDVSAHPFTTSFGPTDVRVTTRVDESNFKDMLWSCIHEGGHALYEQGLSVKDYGLPSSESTSLGIHESQSRLWENNVGRNKHIWNAWYPDTQKVFPVLKNVSQDSFYRAINKVQPSLIRTEADELTYHFHIMIRFELELALIEGTLEVADLEEAWNSKYQEYLGIKVHSAAEGVLQDVHWSHGSFGYFATYSLGSFYAAQFYQQAVKDIPNMEEGLQKGECDKLLQWLRQNIHQHGRMYNSEQICRRVTGETLNFDYFMQYAQSKYGEIYGL